MKTHLKLAAFSALLLCAPLVSRANTTIGAAQTGTVSDFGTPDTQTYGQTITTPTDHILQSFSFNMNLPAALKFQGEVYAWDGTKASGSALYQSAVVSTLGTGMQTITFNVGGANLTAGQQYVLFASSSQFVNGANVNGVFGSNVGSGYAGGTFVFLNNGTDSTQWTSQAWTQTFPTADDLAFNAVFSPDGAVAPLPSSAWGGLALLGGLAGVTVMRKRASSAQIL